MDTAGRKVLQDDGDRLAFDNLVIATGGLAGVHVLRTLDDALALRADLLEGARFVVVGGPTLKSVRDRTLPLARTAAVGMTTGAQHHLRAEGPLNLG